MKTCTVCGETQADNEFRRKDGRCRACYNAYQLAWYHAHREQVTEKWRANRAAAPEVFRGKEQAYWDAHPEGKQAKDARYRSSHVEQKRQNARDWASAHPERVKENKHQYYEQHREELLVYHREYEAQNKEKLSARARDYYQRHKDQIKERVKLNHETNRERDAIYARHQKVLRRAIVPIVFHTEDEWRDKLAQFGGCCAYCDTTERLTRDHILALANGGNDAIDNIQPLCFSCNSRKSARVDREFVTL